MRKELIYAGGKGGAEARRKREIERGTMKARAKSGTGIPSHNIIVTHT